MRIIKLGTSEFSNFEEIEFFFSDDLPNRKPSGKFLIPSPLIGKSGIETGEQLLFSFKGIIYFAALSASQRMDNQDKNADKYPYYFLIDLKSLKRINISLIEIEEILLQHDKAMSIVKSRSWPKITDISVVKLIWQLTNNRNQSKNQSIIRKYGSGGEGVEHKQLKQWIANNPESIGLKNVKSTEIEHSYLSGDSVDILFELTSNEDIVVEIETIDPLPGCHQLIKYRALRCAEKGISLTSSKVQAIIVAWEIPAYVIKFCKKYNIRYFKKKI